MFHMRAGADIHHNADWQTCALQVSSDNAALGREGLAVCSLSYRATSFSHQLQFSLNAMPIAVLEKSTLLSLNTHIIFLSGLPSSASQSRPVWHMHADYQHRTGHTARYLKTFLSIPVHVEAIGSDIP